MRRALMVGSLLMVGCVPRGPGAWPVAPGGSVTDFDRSGSGAAMYSDYATPAGARDTIGIASTEGGSERQTRLIARVEPITPLPTGTLVAGPPQPGRLISDPATIRTLQKALADRGYYQGPI